MDALRDTSDSPATRGDALVFAWRLQLPDRMNVAAAANAVLLSALSNPRSNWTRPQLLIIRELMVLAGREDALPEESAKKPARQTRSKSVRQHRRTTTVRREVSRKAVHSQEGKKEGKNVKAASSTNKSPSTLKQDKDWWTLVGRDDPNASIKRTRKRSERVSRKPYS